MSLRGKLATMSRLQQRLFRSRVYRSTFGTPEGRLVLEDLCRKFSWCDRPTLTAARSQSDTMLATAFYEGQRSVWIYLQRQMRLSETELRELAAEAEAQADPTRQAAPNDPLSMGGNA